MNVLQGDKKPETKPEKDNRIDPKMIPPRTINQGHIKGLIIFTGVEADLPNGKTEVKAYFTTDTNKLFIYNDSVALWKSTTLS